MRIHLLDPGYIHPGGHHVEWDLLIAHNLVERGHEVRLFCNIQASEEATRAFSRSGPATPIFETSPYVWPRSEEHERTLFFDVAESVARELKKLEPADLWLWPTLFSPYLLGCALASPSAQISGCIHNEPSYVLPNGRKWWQQAFAKSLEAGLRLNLSATTPALQGIYARLAPDIPIKRAPIAQNGLTATLPKKQMRKIGFFGQQRKEKGEKLLHPLVNMLLDAGYEVILHDSNGRPESGSRPNLTVLGYLDDFTKEIARCDLVVAPYDPVQYHFRLSGIVAEALASSVPVVVPAGTALMRLVQETGAGVVFSNLTASSIFQSICVAKDRYANLAESAFKTGREWSASHGTENFVSCLLDNVPDSDAQPEIAGINPRKGERREKEPASSSPAPPPVH